MTAVEQIVDAIATGRMTSSTRRSIRSYPAVVDGHQRQIVTCAGCGDSFTVASRTIRYARQQNRELYCLICRNHPEEIQVTVVHRTFWTSIWTMEEIVACAEAIWGPRSQWSE